MDCHDAGMNQAGGGAGFTAEPVNETATLS
jgi:hypothetical protein